MSSILQVNVSESILPVAGTALAKNLGEVAGNKAVKMIIQDSTPNWVGTEADQLPTLEKAGLLGLKVLATVGATAAIIFLPHICIPIACHHMAVSTAAACVVKGAISGSSSGVNEYLTKQINGNYTPDPEKRKELTDTISTLKTGLSITVSGPYVEEIKCAATLIETAAVHAYDSEPAKANDFIDTIKNFFK